MTIDELTTMTRDLLIAKLGEVQDTRQMAMAICHEGFDHFVTVVEVASILFGRDRVLTAPCVLAAWRQFRDHWPGPFQ